MSNTFRNESSQNLEKNSNLFQNLEKILRLSQPDPAAAATRRDRRERARPHTTIEKLWDL